MQRRHLPWYRKPHVPETQTQFATVAFQQVIAKVIEDYGYPAVTTAISTAVDMAWPMILDSVERDYSGEVGQYDEDKELLLETAGSLVDLSNFPEDVPSVEELVEWGASTDEALLHLLQAGDTELIFANLMEGMNRASVALLQWVENASPNNIAGTLATMVQNFYFPYHFFYATPEEREEFANTWTITERPLSRKFMIDWYNEWIGRLLYVS